MDIYLMYNPNPKKVGTFCKMQQNQESCDLLIPFNIYLIDKSKKKKKDFQRSQRM